MSNDKKQQIISIISAISGLLQLRTSSNSGVCGTTKEAESPKTDSVIAAFCDQAINAAIVATISGISTFMATTNTETGLSSAAIAAGMTFLWTFVNKLKEYRGLKE